jgi:hypothetical protein
MLLYKTAPPWYNVNMKITIQQIKTCILSRAAAPGLNDLVDQFGYSYSIWIVKIAKILANRELAYANTYPTLVTSARYRNVPRETPPSPLLENPNE